MPEHPMRSGEIRWYAASTVGPRCSWADGTSPRESSRDYSSWRWMTGKRTDSNWLIDDVGRVAVEFSYDDEKKVWELKARKDGQMTAVANGKAEVDLPK